MSDRCGNRAVFSKGGTIQIRFLGGKLGKAIADKFEVSTVGDLLYGSPLALIGANKLKCVMIRPISLGAYNAIKATIPGCLLICIL